MLACLQIFQRVLGEGEDIVLIDVVLRVCALVGRAVAILHRELAATVSDTEHSALVFGVALLCLKHVQLAYPINLRVPSTQRIDAEGLCNLGVACFFLIADAGEQRRQVEEQAVVVFCPSRAFESDELGAVVGIHFKSFVDGVR